MNALSWVTGIASAYRKEQSEFMELENQCKIDSKEIEYIWRYNLSGQSSSRPGKRDWRVRRGAGAVLQESHKNRSYLES